MAIIKIDGLTKRFGPVLAVDRLSFQVERGTVVGFLGPNGAGKTTTLRMLLGLVRPDSGTATINGRAYADLTEPLHQVGAVLEATGFHPGRTPRNHLRIQPANGLDPEGVRWLRDLLRGLASEGSTVLVSSHILAEVAQTVDSVIILDHGRLITQSSLTELTAGARRVIRVRTPKAEELRAALTADGAGVRIVSPDRVEITGAAPERVAVIAAERSIPIVESTTDAAGLEDVFLSLTANTTQEVSR